jgi:tetratricopeptide (TPR) repeat protein
LEQLITAFSGNVIQQEVENGKWLCHAKAEFSVDSKKLEEEHLEGTCEWFLSNPKVTNWSESNSTIRFLWVYGKPGCGKSTIASRLIHHLETFRSPTPKPIIQILCKSGMENRSDVLSVLRNVIHQLIETPSSTQHELHSMVTAERVAAKTTFATSMQQLWSLLGRLLESTEGCFCVIDGLDECSNTEQEIADFVRRLTTTFSESTKTTKAVIFSRFQQPAIEFQNLWECHHIGDADVEGDIQLFVSTKLKASSSLSNHKDKGRLQEVLVNGAEGMILWAGLMLAELERPMKRWNVDAVLNKPPKSLEAVYSGILERLSKNPDALERGRHALRLVLAASRPLHRDEFALAIATMEGLSDHEDYDRQSNPARDCREIVDAVAPLITILPNNTIQLVHASLKDYLLSDHTPGETNSQTANFFFRPTELHGPVTTALLSYLSFPCFKDKLPETDINKRYPLLEYSCCQLIRHIVKVGENFGECIQRLTSFFQSSHGERWLERLTHIYDLSLGHQLVLQAQLKEWVDRLPENTAPDKDIFDHLLLRLGQMRVTENPKLGADFDEDSLVNMGDLAAMYFKQGQWKESEELYQQVVEKRKRVLGEDHPDTLDSMGFLASTFSDQGRWLVTEELYQQVVEKRKRVQGEDHPDTLTSMDNLAWTFMNQGRWPEGEELYQQVVEKRKRVQGEDHPDTLTSMNNLASTFSNQGRWQEAEKLYQQVVEKQKRVLGEDHPATLTSMHNLGVTYKRQGRIEEAISIVAEAVSLSSVRFGEEHPETKSSAELLIEWRNQAEKSST